MHDTDIKKDNFTQQKELFVATLIHDLKNPLQAQICSLNLLRNGHFGDITKAQEEIIDIIIESASFMQEMLHSVLDIYRIDNGIIKLNPKYVNIDEIIETCIKEFYNSAIKNDLKLEYINNAKTTNIYADAALMRRVFANMLNNALNYSLKNTTVSVIFSENNEYIYIKIRNSGYKIPEEIKQHIFDKYVSGISLNKKAGIGLGLYYCKKVVEAHNGIISLDDNNNFNEFTIQLPKCKISDINKTLNFV